MKFAKPVKVVFRWFNWMIKIPKGTYTVRIWYDGKRFFYPQIYLPVLFRKRWLFIFKPLDSDFVLTAYKPSVFHESAFPPNLLIDDFVRYCKVSETRNSVNERDIEI